MVTTIVLAGTIGVALVWGTLTVQVASRASVRNGIAVLAASLAAAATVAWLAGGIVFAVWFLSVAAATHLVWRIAHG